MLSWRLLCLNILVITEVSTYGYNFHYFMDEEMEVGEIIGDLKKDFLYRHRNEGNVLKDASLLRFSFSPSSKSHSRFFQLDNYSGTISNSQVLDREFLCKPGGPIPSCRFAIDVQVTPKKYFAILKIIVELKDINDNPPKFLKSEHKFELPDQAKEGYSFQFPTAQDDDTDEFGIEKYFIRNDSDQIFIDTFILVSHKMLDGSFDVRLELRNRAHLNDTKILSGFIVAADKGTPPKIGILSVVITIFRTSEIEPKFELPSYRFYIAENVDTGAFVGQVKASSIGEAPLQYLIQRHLGDSKKLPFRLNTNSGKIYVNGSVDYEKNKSFRFNIIAVSVTPPGTSSINVDVEVIDMKDSSSEIIINSIFSINRAKVKENSPVGTFVSRVGVFDKGSDLNERPNCYVQSSFFTLDAISNTTDDQEFKLISAVSFDREELSKYDVQIVCEDFENPSLSSSIMIEIDILDENDNAPFFSQDNFTIDLPENIANGFSPLLKLQATDIDEGQNAVLTYFLESQETNLSFTSLLFIDELDGGIYSRHTFDCESHPRSFTYLVKAVDSGETKLTGSATLILNILDVNDNVPRFDKNLYEFHISRNNFFEGILIGVVNSFDDDVTPANSKVTYTIDNSIREKYFRIDPFTGEIYLIELPPEEFFYKFNVTASNTFAKVVLNSSVQVIVYLNGTSRMSITIPAVKSDIQMFTGSVHRGDPIFQIKIKNIDLIKPQFYMLSGNIENEFEINPDSGSIIATKAIKQGLSFYNFTIKIMDENRNYEQEIFNLPIFVNNTNDQLSYFGAWTIDSRNFALIICIAIIAILFLTILLAIKHKNIKLAKRTSRILTNDFVAKQNMCVIPNFYEFEASMQIKDDLNRHKEIEFSQMTFEDTGKCANHDELKKTNLDISYDLWQACSKKSCEEEASLADSGKGTSDEGEVVLFPIRKIKDCKASETVGLDNFNHSIINRERAGTIHFPRLNSASFKKDALLPMIPLILPSVPTLQGQSRENCELCLMDQWRKKADPSTRSITTIV